MSDSPSIAVLVSSARHPLSALPCVNRDDVVAMELARSLASSVRVVHAGEASDPALTHYLAYGIRRLEVVAIRDGDDLVATLAAVLADTDVILCGARARNGAGSALLPYLLGAQLDRPVIADAMELRVAADRLKIMQGLPKGVRRAIDAPCRAVVAVHPRAHVTPRYAYAQRLAGRIEPLPAAASAAPVAPALDWVLDGAVRAPLKLRGAEHRAGHARMQAAIGGSARGGQVVIEGDSVAKARLLLAYLREHGIIDP